MKRNDKRRKGNRMLHEYNAMNCCYKQYMKETLLQGSSSYTTWTLKIISAQDIIRD